MIKTAFKILMGFIILFILIAVILWATYFIFQPMQETTNLLEQTSALDSSPTFSGASMAFAHALRLNHENMYELTDSSLHPRLVEWTEQHEVTKNPFWNKRCETLFIGSRNSGSVLIQCPTYTFIVENVESVYENGEWHIVDWSGVKEMP
jgi:hypothetical protein